MRRVLPWIIGIIIGTAIPGVIFGIFLWPTLFTEPAHSVTTYDPLPASGDRAIPTPPAELRMLFVGDIMLARGVEWRIGQEGLDYPLADVAETIGSADITIGNFEGTIREQQTIELGGSFAFDTTPEIAGMLADVGFDILSLANNHGDDHGPSTTAFTRQTIADLSMMPFGDPLDSPSHVARIDRDGFALSFVGYHAFLEDIEPIERAIANEKAANRFVIVYPHWGPEYQATPHASAEVSPGHRFVDAGADLVIGAHPHVIQSIETYNGVPIVYSLGNFLFDQDWSVPTQQGMTALVTLTQDDITLDFSTVQVTKQKTTPHDDAASAALLAEYDIPTTLTLPRLSVSQTP